MKGVLIGLGVVIVLFGGAFIALLIMADANAPDAEEIRIEVTDELRSGR